MMTRWNRRFRSALETHVVLTRDIFDEQNHFASAREKFLAALPYWVAGSVTALVSILYARIFQFVENMASMLYQRLGMWTLLSTPLLFLLSWWLVEKFAAYANGSGIPQLMASAEIVARDQKAKVVESLLGLRIIFIKIISSLLAVLGGGAIGREGPTLQIAGSIFDITSRFLPERLKKQNRQGMILAGGAAGLAAAFNTPLGGIAYVIEELSKSHLSFFRTGILHAVVVSGLISQLVMGSYLYLGYPRVSSFSLGQLGMVVVVSVAAGLIGTLFGQALKYLFNYRATLKTGTSRAGMAFICGLVFAVLMVFASTTTVGSGRELIDELLFNAKQASVSDLLCRFVGSVATYASGGAGGIFAPTLAIGGAAGSLTEVLLFSTSGPLAVLAGMTAALAALTHSPLTSFILILEMTDRHSAILPIMVAAMIGQGLSKLIARESFYEFVAKRLLKAISPTETEANKPQ